MQTCSRFSSHRASLRVMASMSLAAFILSAGFAMADDTTPQTGTPKKQTTVKTQGATTTDAKDTKAVSDSASKVDLTTPVTRLNFYGSATVGYETTFGKTPWACKNGRHSGMFSELQLGTDFHLTKDVTMSVLVGAGRYPNGYGLFR